MEEEYTSLQKETNAENIKVIQFILKTHLYKLSFYFLVFLLIIPLIPALIGSHYLDVGLTIAAAFVLTLLFLWKAIPRVCAQFLVALVICSFNYLLLLLPSASFDSTSKGLMMLRGYAFASVNVILVSRFSNMKLQMIFLAFSYAIRFALMISLDPESAQVYTIIRHVYIDLFVLYVNFCHDRRNRDIFKRFYDQREELAKFKELLSENFPQCVSIFLNFPENPIFFNKAFLSTFQAENTPENCLNLQTSDIFGVMTADRQKTSFELLQIHRNTLKELERSASCLHFSSENISLQDVVSQLIRNQILGCKPLYLSAFDPDGDDAKSFEVVITKMKWEGENAIVLILNDTSFQEKIINLKVLDAYKDKVIATVSHELRTPLNGIIGILGMVRRKVKDLEITEYLNLCSDNAHLLLSLVNSLLDLQQIRQGKLRLNSSKIHVEKIFREIIRLFIFQCSNKGIYLDLKVNDNVPSYIYTDENRLKQILINLIGNALKFTSKGGITVSVYQDASEPEYIKISVSDTGIGIKEEDQNKLFQMYGKLEHGKDVNKNGVGLGLTISNTLAALLSKSTEERVIKVESKLNQETIFSFKILKALENFAESTKVKKETDEKSIDKNEDLQIPLEYSQKIPDQIITLKINEYDFSKLHTCYSFATKHNSERNNKHEKRGSSFLHLNSDHCGEDTERECILTVDDNPFNLLVAQSIINNINYSFLPAKSGPEAIEIVKSVAKQNKTFKAILMDCQMPIMDGFETTKILTQMMSSGEIKSIPIIALTANNEEEQIKRCFESGMVDYLSKPLFANDLQKLLSKHI